MAHLTHELEMAELRARVAAVESELGALKAWQQRQDSWFLGHQEETRAALRTLSERFDTQWREVRLAIEGRWQEVQAGQERIEGEWRTATAALSAIQTTMARLVETIDPRKGAPA